MKSYDAVIIGAGHNALACAAHLGKRGWSVGLFEAADQPGGAVKTAELTLPGFRHDVAAMNMSLFAGSPFHKAYATELAAHGLAFAPAADCFASVFSNGRWVGVSTDLATTQQRIAAFSSRDAKTWGKLVAEFPDRAATIFAVLGSPMRKRAIARNAFASWRSSGLSGSLELMRLFLSSPRAWLDETFESAEVKAMLAAWGMHLDFAPDVAGGAIFPYLEGMANQSFGMVLGQGGASNVIDALVGMVRANGGEVHCSREVRRVETGPNGATGIVLADGEKIAARRAVIGSVAPRALASLLPDGSGSCDFDLRMSGFRHAPGTMMIHLALDGMPDWADEALKRFAYVHVAPSMDMIALAYAQAMAGLLPAEPVIVVGQPTAIDATRAPEGRHVLWLQVRMAPALVKGDAAGRIASRDWAEIAEPFADRVIDILERHAPGLRGRILARNVQTPLDLERGNANLVGGDQICGSHHLSQNFLFRPAAGHANGDTPVRSLYLTGAATWPGAGVGAGSGFMLARRLAGG